MHKRNSIALTAVGLGVGIAARSFFAHRNEENLKNQVVLITGGSKGLGIALARQFAAEGCRLAICARQREELHSAKRELEGRGAQVLAVTCDVSDESQVKQMIAEVEAHYGRIDILVNNAGHIQVGPITSMTVDSAMKVIFWGVVFPTLALIPTMVQRKRGKIVNIITAGGKVSVPEMAPYACARFAATGFSEGLRAELGGEGIQVTTVAPAPTMAADSAAKKIVTAVKTGEAKAISVSHGVFPGAAADLLGLAATTFLPKLIGPASTKTGAGLESLKSSWMKILLTLGESAAKRYRQRPA